MNTYNRGPAFPLTRKSKYDGQGHWAPNSSTPPGGWFPVIAGTAVVLVVAGAVMYIGAAVGF